MKILPKMKKEGMVINVYGICVCKMHVSFTLKSYIFIAIVSNAFEEDVLERNISCSNDIGKNGGKENFDTHWSHKLSRTSNPAYLIDCAY